MNSTPSSIFFTKGVEVTSDIVDGEAIIVNLRTGNYYSLTGSGPEIWRALVAGVEIPRLVTHLANTYDQDVSVVQASVDRLLVELVKEELLKASESRGASPDFTFGVPPEKSFTAPKLEKYSDLQDLLVLDPIHETDESGWPNRPTSESKETLPA